MSARYGGRRGERLPRSTHNNNAGGLAVAGRNTLVESVSALGAQDRKIAMSRCPDVLDWLQDRDVLDIFTPRRLHLLQVAEQSMRQQSPRLVGVILENNWAWATHAVTYPNWDPPR